KGSVNMRLLDVAARYLAPGSSSPACVGQAQAHERHPLQLAEPVVLTHFVLGEQSVACASGTSTISLPLCAGWEQSAELSADVLGSAEKVFGLIHFEQQRWVLRPLSIAAKNGKLTFAGQNGAKLLAKPPKSSSVAILQERASRLLRA
ncbi:MAG TPA: hypothetical protein VFT99_03105, partial [Roseiflexaceae bacterium]|nr:hypothetical protein [Roseiflexaceae bacterium]